MSSQSLIKIVAKELNHYFNKTRFEEGFDNSNFTIPQVKHHPIKPKTMVTFSVDYDRDIKHYFSHPELRIFLTQFENLKDVNHRQEILQQILEHYMRTYLINDGVLKPLGYKRRARWVESRPIHCHPRFRNIAHINYIDKELPCYRDPTFSYIKHRENVREKLRNKGKKKFPRPHTGYPVFKNTPNPEISRGHAERLVNVATKMLCSSQQIRHKKSRYSTTAPGAKLLFYQPNEPIDVQELSFIPAKPSKPSLKVQRKNDSQIASTESVGEPVSRFRISRSKRDTSDTVDEPNEKSASPAKTPSPDTKTSPPQEAKATTQNSNSIRSHSKLKSANIHNSNSRTQKLINPYMTQPYNPPTNYNEPLPRWLIRELEKCMEDKMRKLNNDPISRKQNYSTEMISDNDSDEVSELSESSDYEKSRIVDTPKICVSEQAQFVRHYPPPSQSRIHGGNSNRISRRRATPSSSSNRQSKYKVMTPVEEEDMDKRSPQFKTIAGLQCRAAVQTERKLLTNYDQSMDFVDENEGSVEYQVIIDTGDKLGASTRAAVFLSLIGTLGRSREKQLVDSHTHRVPFRKGRSDLFTMNYPHVGPLLKIQIGHNDMDPASNWFLESVTIVDRKYLQRHVFTCRQWLGHESRETKVVLIPSSTVDISEVDKATVSDKTVENQQRELKVREDTVEDVKKNTPRSEAGATFDSLDGEVSQRSSLRDTPAEGKSEVLVSPEDEHECHTEEYADDCYSSENESLEALSNDNTDLHAMSKIPTEKESPSKYLRNNSNRIGIDQSGADSPRHEIIREPSKLSFNDRSLQSVENIELEPLKVIEDNQCEIRSDRANSSEGSDIDVEEGRSVDSISEPVRIQDPQNDAFDIQAELRQPINLNPEEENEVNEMIQKRIADSFLRGCSIHEAIKLNQYARVLQLLQMFKWNISAEDEHGYLPAHTASEAGYPDILELLVHFEASFDVETPTGYLPVHLAALNGHLKSLQTLHRLGISLDTCDQEGNSLIHLAARCGHLNVVKWLVEEMGMPVIKNHNNETPEEVAEIFGFPLVSDYFRSTKSKSENISQEDSLIILKQFAQLVQKFNNDTIQILHAIPNLKDS